MGSASSGGVCAIDPSTSTWPTPRTCRGARASPGSRGHADVLQPVGTAHARARPPQKASWIVRFLISTCMMRQNNRHDKHNRCKSGQEKGLEGKGIPAEATPNRRVRAFAPPARSWPRHRSRPNSTGRPACGSTPWHLPRATGPMPAHRPVVPHQRRRPPPGCRGVRMRRDLAERTASHRVRAGAGGRRPFRAGCGRLSTACAPCPGSRGVASSPTTGTGRGGADSRTAARAKRRLGTHENPFRWSRGGLINTSSVPGPRRRARHLFGL
jgi:hypothetical protein